MAGRLQEADREPGRAHESTGLSHEDVEKRREEYGLNVLPAPPRVSLWRRLLSQLVHFFAVMLWIAGGLAILAGMPQLGFAIFVVILLNGLFAFLLVLMCHRKKHRRRSPRGGFPLIRGAGACQWLLDNG